MSLPTSGFSGNGGGGTIVGVPVTVTALANGLGAVNIPLTFQKGVFNFPMGGNGATGDVSLGQIPTTAPSVAANWNLTANSTADGQLNITLAAKPGKTISTSIASGTLVLINFPISPNYNANGAGTSVGQTITIAAHNGSFNCGIVQGGSAGGTYTLSPAPPYTGTVTVNGITPLPPTVLTPGTTATGTAVVDTTNMVVSSVTITNAGSGYTAAPTVTLIGGDGSGATGAAVLGTGTTAGQVASVNITNGGSAYLNLPPIVSFSPAPLNFSTESNTTINQAAPGILAGASDPQHTAITVNMINGAAYTIGTPVTLPSGATLTVIQDGSFSYVPASNFVGQDSFTFNAQNFYGEESNTGSVKFAVTPTLSIVPEGFGTLMNGDTITEDVVMGNPNPTGGVGPVSGFNVAITYDPSLLSTPSDGSGTLLGAYMPADWKFTPTAMTPGVVDIDASGSGSGSDLVTGPAPIVLATLTFTVVGHSTTTTNIDLVAAVQTASGPASTAVSGSTGAFFLNPSLPGQVTGLALTNAGTGYTSPPSITFSGGGGTGASAVATLVNGGMDAGGDPIQAIQLTSQGNSYTSTPQVIFSSGGATATATISPVPIGTFIPGVDTQIELSALTIKPNNVPAGDVGSFYNETISVSGGSAPYSFSFTGTLPAGLLLSSGGVLSGTPTVPGTFNFAINATDGPGDVGFRAYSLTINPAVAITTTTLSDWTVSLSGYSKTINVVGGSGTYTLSTTGTMPMGLTLNSAGIVSGTPTTTGSYTFTITATDTVGGSTTETYMVVINPPLTIATTTLPYWNAGLAGYSQTIRATGGTSPLTFSMAAGTLPPGLTLNSSSGLLSGTPTTAGSYTFTVTAKDTVGASANQSFTVVINEVVSVIPSSLASDTVGIAYSQTIVASGGTSPYTFAKTAGTLPPGVTLSSAGILSGTPSAAAAFNFTVTATDALGSSGSQTYTVTINQGVSIATPTLGNWTAGWPGYGQIIVATGGTGTVTFFKSGSLPSGLALSSAGTLLGTPTTPGSYTFTVIATDSVGAFASRTYSVTISPALTFITTSLPAGRLATPYSQTIIASGGTGLLTYSRTASTLPPGLTLNSAGVLGGSPTATGSFTFTVTATDTIGASASQNYSLFIGPGPFVEYVVAVFGATTVQAGSAFQVTVQAADQSGNPVSSYSGPMTVTASISPTNSASSFPTTLPLNSSGFGFFIADLQKVGTYTISVADTSHTYTGSAPAITVTAGLAAKLSFAAQPVNTPTGVTLPMVTVDVLDVYGNVVTGDNADSVTVGVGSGPGPFTSSSTVTASVRNGVAAFNNLVLMTPGVYQLSALDPGMFTGPFSSAFTIAPLQVIPGSFVGSPSGFSLQFNAPFLVNSITPVLYGQGFGATARVPSVTLTGPSGPVDGSLVLDTASNTITFVATNTASMVNYNEPILLAGTYTAVVHASASNNGFQALNSGGGFLDGLGMGIAGSGDFTAKFVVNVTTANAAVLWVPATADGPGQALSAPGANRIGGGYPLYLTDGRGVTSVNVTLNYNPALLNVTGVTGSGFSLSASSTPGHAVLQYSGPALAPSSALNPIPVTVGFITATVPGGTPATPTPYKAKDLLHLSAVSLNGGSVPAATSDGLHLVAYPGDANGDGTYSGDDAVRITRAVLQTDTGFTAYPLVDPVIVADTDGSGFIPADAPLQVNEAGVGVPTANLPIPPIPSGVVFQAIANNVDPCLSIPAALHVGADGTVTVPVNIDDGHPAGSTGLIRGQLALTYDPRLFTVAPADVHFGSVLTAGIGWTLDVSINSVTGEIAIRFSSTMPITSSAGGNLVTIDLHPIGTDASGLPPIALVASVNPTGQQVVTTGLEDAQGVFTLTPAPF